MSEIKYKAEIESKEKAIQKLEEVFSNPKAQVPDSEVIEQASSFTTAEYVASLIPDNSIVADLTAGLGVNTFSFAKKAAKVYAIEKDHFRASILENNVSVNQINNIIVIKSDCEPWIENTYNLFDVIFIDPSRRDKLGKKFVSFENCSPDIKKLFPIIQNKGKRLLIKSSPLFDIDAAIDSFPNIRSIRIVEFNREVKEVILDIDLSMSDKMELPSPEIICCLIGPGNLYKEISFKKNDKKLNDSISYLEGGNSIECEGFVYEPSPSLMKSGYFGALLKKNSGIKKLSKNTHLFYSKNLYKDFPGRIFKVKESLSSKDLKKLKGERFNVISRNHPAKASEIETRFKLKSSEDKFLIACTINNKKYIFSTIKIT